MGLLLNVADIANVIPMKVFYFFKWRIVGKLIYPRKAQSSVVNT